MKARRLAALALGMLAVGAFLLPLVTSAATTWNSPYNLGSGGSKPSVAIDAQGNIHYIWWNFTAKTIQYTVCAGLTQNSCGQVETLPNNGGESFYPGIAIDPQGRANAVWESRDGGSYSIYWSRRDSGQWVPIQKISNEPYSELPDIAIGPQGTIHIVYQSKQDTTGYIYYVESDDGFGTVRTRQIDSVTSDQAIGIAAHAAENGLTPEGQQLTNGLYPRVTADSDDRAHVVWNAPSPYGIYYRIQEPTGDFGNKITVSTGHKDQTPDITFSPNGSVGILWGTYDTYNAAFAEYKDGQPDLKKYDVDGGLAQSLWPRVAAQCNGLYLFAFQGKTAVDGNWNIYARTYNSETNKFGTRVTIGDTGSQEQTPSVAATHLGAIIYTNTSTSSAMGSTTDLGISCGTTPTDTPTVSPTATDTPVDTQTPTATSTIDPAVTPTVTSTDQPTATPTSTEIATETPTTTATAPITDTPTPTMTVTTASGTEHLAPDDPRIVYTGTWKKYQNRKAPDKYYLRCGGNNSCKKNWTATLDFTGGTRVEWLTAYAQTYGKVFVYIDNVLFEQIDLCQLNKNSAAPRFGARTYVLSGDATTAHSIKIRALGKHSNCSPYASKYVSVSGFNIVR